MPSELLRQVRVIDPVSNTDHIRDVWIEENHINAIAESIQDVPDSVTVLDCQGLVLGPGLVDLYSHSGEPGFEDRETLDSLMNAAIAGGFTHLTLLPDTNPALDNPAVLEWLHTQAHHRSIPHLSYWGALTRGAAGQQMTDLAELADAGVIGFADGKPINNLLLIRRLLEYGQSLGKPVALWGCDRELSTNGVVRDGSTATQLGLVGVPAIAETAALAAILECVATFQTPVHLMRLSTARGVELVRAAKAQGLAVTASTTWMHLLLNITAVQTYDPSLRVDPPLGNPDDQAALIQGINDGVIDAIAIDHTPLTYEEKTVPFAEAPSGMIGLELALPLLWQELVASNQVSALALWRSLSVCPARCLQQPSTPLAPGQPADLILFNPEAMWDISPSHLKSQSWNTPWLDQSVKGRVVKVWG